MAYQLVRRGVVTVERRASVEVVGLPTSKREGCYLSEMLWMPVYLESVPAVVPLRDWMRGRPAFLLRLVLPHCLDPLRMISTRPVARTGVEGSLALAAVV